MCPCCPVFLHLQCLIASHWCPPLNTFPNASLKCIGPLPRSFQLFATMCYNALSKCIGIWYRVFRAPFSWEEVSRAAWGQIYLDTDCLSSIILQSHWTDTSMMLVENGELERCNRRNEQRIEPVETINTARTDRCKLFNCTHQNRFKRTLVDVRDFWSPNSHFQFFETNEKIWKIHFSFLAIRNPKSIKSTKSTFFLAKWMEDQKVDANPCCVLRKVDAEKHTPNVVCSEKWMEKWMVRSADRIGILVRAESTTKKWDAFLAAHT